MDNENKDYIIMLAKVEWYEELLQLEPHSKLFLPYARLLFEFGKNEDNPTYYKQATKILRDGLEIHQDFMEARLFLIEVLHHCGYSDQCGFEVAKLASLFLSYPDFWDAWREHVILENDQTDLSVALGFMGALSRDKSLTLKDIFETGLSNISPSINVDKTREVINSIISNKKQENSNLFSSPVRDESEPFDSVESIDESNISYNAVADNSIDENFDLDQTEDKDFEPFSQGEGDTLFLEQQIMEAADLDHDQDGNLFESIPDTYDTNNLDLTNETNFDEDFMADEDASFEFDENQDENVNENIDESPADTSFVLDGKGVNQDIIEPATIDDSIGINNDFSNDLQGKEQNSSPQEMLASLLSDSNIIVEPMNSSPFRTRSMAEVLVDQGNTKEAIDIYQELILKAESQNAQNEVIALKERLKELETKVNNIDLKDNFQFEDEPLDEIVIENSEEKPVKEKKIKIQASIKGANNIEEKSNVKSTQKAVDLLNKLASRLEAKAS